MLRHRHRHRAGAAGGGGTPARARETLHAPVRWPTQAPGSAKGSSQIRFDASPELRQRSPDETEMDRTDDGLVGRRHLLEGAALQHDLLPALGSPELGPETELLVETNDLVDRLLLRDRRKRWRLADEVRAPRPSSLLGASAGVALRASEGAGEDLRKEAIAGERACVERLGRGLVEDARPARAGALLASCRDEACLGEDAKVRTDGVHVQTDARSKLTGVERRLSLLQDFEDPHTAWVARVRDGASHPAERLPGSSSLSRSDRIDVVGV